MLGLKRGAVCCSAQQNVIRQLLSGYIQQWSQHWFAREAELEFTFNQQLFGGLVNSLEPSPGNAAIHVLFHETKKTLTQLLKFSSGFEGEVTPDDTQRFGKPFCAVLTADLTERCQSFADNSVQYQLSVRIKLGECEFWVYPTAAWVVAQLDKADNIERHRFSLTEAVLPLRTFVTLDMPAHPMTFQQLQQITVGTVIPLNRKLTDPLPLTGNGQYLFQGYLVEQQQHKAVYLTARTEKLKS
ncbi:MAG TPA: hypothetical protein DF774_08430 [Rheinheimera sp.]|uniref:FliM/FliN family flagellar motor C-terminal domain-containing protein n=1 Tax=Rheinheimera sp. TaxID=1869214 RepID=UPI000EC52ADF|nr:FliM/FliN family flagellar motor C-terminal domain-containing protein [Rheinheimera sp.]HCU65771.1 hypothetical protein [Rheinheimera sp.]